MAGPARDKGLFHEVTTWGCLFTWVVYPRPLFLYTKNDRSTVYLRFSEVLTCSSRSVFFPLEAIYLAVELPSTPAPTTHTSKTLPPAAITSPPLSPRSFSTPRAWDLVPVASSRNLAPSQKIDFVDF